MDLAAKLRLPPGVSIRPATQEESRTHSTDSPAELFFYAYYLRTGMTFPFPPLIRDFWARTGLAPSQLHPNVYKILNGILTLNRNALLDLDVDQVLHVYGFQCLPRKPGQYFLAPRYGSMKLVTHVDTTNKAWDAEPIVLCGGWGSVNNGPEIPREWNLKLAPKSLEVRKLSPAREAVLYAALKCKDRKQSDLVDIPKKRKPEASCSSPPPKKQQKGGGLTNKQLAAKRSCARAREDMRSKLMKLIASKRQQKESSKSAKPWTPAFVKSRDRPVTLEDSMLDEETSEAFIQNLVLPRDSRAWAQAEVTELLREGSKEILRGLSRMSKAIERAERNQEIKCDTVETLRRQHIQVDQLLGQVQTLSHEKSELQSCRDQHEVESQHLKAEIQRLRDEFSNAQKEVHRLEVQLQGLKEEHEAETHSLKEAHRAELSKATKEEYEHGFKTGRDKGLNQKHIDQHKAEIRRLWEEHQAELSRAKKEEFTLPLKMGQEQGYQQGYNEGYTKGRRY